VRLWNGLVHRQIHRRGVHVPGGGSSAAAEMKSETVTHTFDRASPERLDRSATSADDLDSRLDVLVVRRATPRARSGCSSPRRARTSVTFAVRDTTAAASPVLRAFREDLWRYIEVDSARGRHARGAAARRVHRPPAGHAPRARAHGREGRGQVRNGQALISTVFFMEY
jgi:hypothetical protein